MSIFEFKSNIFITYTLVRVILSFGKQGLSQRVKIMSVTVNRPNAQYTFKVSTVSSFAWNSIISIHVHIVRSNQEKSK